MPFLAGTIYYKDEFELIYENYTCLLKIMMDRVRKSCVEGKEYEKCCEVVKNVGELHFYT